VNVLVVGSGGREHALSWAIARSPLLNKLYVAPGNGGTADIAENVPVGADDIDGLCDFASSHDVGLTVVGPEAPLVAGIVDRFEAKGLRCFGPRKAAARLEGSKAFAKEFMKRHGIPTARFETFDDAETAKAYLTTVDYPVVIKVDGLAQGKGVIIAKTVAEATRAIDDIMVAEKFGASGARVVIEEFLSGEEVSVHAICSSGRALLLPASQDHKRAYDGDKGPNTGGMGAYAPVPFFGASERDEVYENVVLRTIRGMEGEKASYTGVLYAGMILTAGGPKVLEFNVRFGDPETQAILPLLRDDLLELLNGAASGEPAERVELYEDRSVATVVMASKGYPGSYEKGAQIDGIDDAVSANRMVFHAGTKRDSGRLLTSGGRVLAVSAWANKLDEAVAGAYDGVGRIAFEGAFWRNDIGRKARVGPMGERRHAGQ
jgi:phosphoribosylamine--glycine ligase